MSLPAMGKAEFRKFVDAAREIPRRAGESARLRDDAMVRCLLVHVRDVGRRMSALRPV